MNISDAGLRLIAEFEGFVPVPCNDPAGNCTVGYGDMLHLGPCSDAERATPAITEDEGRARLAVKVQSYAACVEANTRPLAQHEFDALTSFCYNIGPGGYLNSSVRGAVNRNEDVCAALRQYVHGSDGVVYPGLQRRREAECAMFNAKEEEDVKPFMAWDKDRQRAYLIGPWGAAWITQAPDVTALEGLFGKTAVAFSAATIDAIGAA